MKTRTKAVAAGTVLVLGGLGAGTGVAAASGADINPLDDRDVSRAEQVAREHVGTGEVTDAEAEDDGAGVAYEVEITRPDGTQVDVELDKDHTVLTATEEGRDADDEADTDADGPDDRTLGDAERNRAEQAALAEVGTGQVTDTSAEHDVVGGDRVAYEVEVTRGDGTEVDVLLDRDLAVVTTVEDGTSDDGEDADSDGASDEASDGASDGASDDASDGADDD